MKISDLVRDIKNDSSNFINEQNWIDGNFSWQDGYGAFSYSHKQIENVYEYVLKQETHHKKQSFMDEYLELLRKFEIDYNEKFLFDWLE